MYFSRMVDDRYLPALFFDQPAEFDTSSFADHKRGGALRIFYERVWLIGGIFSVDSKTVDF